MHQVILTVGPLILRPLIERELGGELLGEGNVNRWMRARTDLLLHGSHRDPAHVKHGPPGTDEAMTHLRLASELARLDIDETVLPADHHIVVTGLRLHYLGWGRRAHPPLLFLRRPATTSRATTHANSSKSSPTSLWDDTGLTLLDDTRLNRRHDRRLEPRAVAVSHGDSARCT